MEKREYVELYFSYTDEYGQESKLSKTISNVYLEDGTMPFLLDEFKKFLLGAGFAYKQVQYIKYEEE
jgi:hypothetical protein